MRSAICKLSICLAFTLKFATSYSFLEINIGFGTRVALLFGLLEQLVGKITLLPVQDVLDPALNIAEAGKKKEEMLDETLLLVPPTESTLQPHFEFCLETAFDSFLFLTVAPKTIGTKWFGLNTSPGVNVPSKQKK